MIDLLKSGLSYLIRLNSKSGLMFVTVSDFAHPVVSIICPDDAKL